MRRVVSVVLILAFAALVSPTPLVLAQQGTGNVVGTATDAAKNPLANHTVRLRNMSTGQITSVTQSAADGAFNFAGVNPGNYQIVIFDAAGIQVAQSPPIAVAAGTTATVTVTASALAGTAVGAGAGALAGLFSGTSLIAVTAAGVVAVGIAVAATQDDSSPSR